MSLIQGEVRITQNDPNVTPAVGVANTETKIFAFTVPDRTWYKIRPGDIFSLLAQDTTPTGIAATSLVKVRVTDPNGIVKNDIVAVDYTTVVEFQDRNKLFTIGQEVGLRPKDQLHILVTANLATATANTRFQISAKRLADVGGIVG